MKKTVRKTQSRTKRQQKNVSVLRKYMARAKYLPAIVIALAATVLGFVPHSQHPDSRGVLAYATNVSAAGLLTGTNAQRSANGVGTLAVSSLLAAAAQAKAQDMVDRNYWSHQTPDGQQPWVFITNAGYQYSSAGENLAYGFMTSNDTITGWMNSPPHKANLLSGNFTEVGFGIANSANYVGNGQQTVVVALYGKPLTASAPPVAATQPPASKPATKPASTQPKPAPAPVAEEPVEPIAQPEPIAMKDEESISTSTEDVTVVATAAPTEVKRVAVLSAGNPFLSVGAVVLAVVSAGLLWLIHKGFRLRRYILAGEHFIAHHIHLDLTVLAIVYLGFVLLSTSGAVR